MIRAYEKTYLEKARVSLGNMLDFAVYDLKFDLTDFFDLFVASGLASRFGKGDSELISGMSGVELAYTVLRSVGQNAKQIKPRYTVNRSEEYWTGWALAYYQWATALTFAEIVKYIPICDIRALYIPYHEMDIRQFADKMTELLKAAKPETNLKLYRMKAGFSQKELSDISGVPLRTIQQYEQRQKNINKAQAEYLFMLARALCCKPEELIEYTAE